MHTSRVKMKHTAATSVEVVHSQHPTAALHAPLYHHRAAAPTQLVMVLSVSTPGSACSAYNWALAQIASCAECGQPGIVWAALTEY